MPTKNPRLSITFKPSFIARLRRLSELTGNSQGALAAELLEGSIPALDRLIKLLEAAQGAKDDVLERMQAELEGAQSRVETQLGLVLDDADQVVASFVEDAEKIARRSVRSGTRMRPAAGAAASVTPPSNRGVRSPIAHARKAP